MDQALIEATKRLGEVDQPSLLLQEDELPPVLAGLRLAHDALHDNDALARELFADVGAPALRSEYGRLTGWVRRFAADARGEKPGAPTAAGVTCHLYTGPEDVERWVTQVFPGRFEGREGQKAPAAKALGLQLAAVRRVKVPGLRDISQGMRVTIEDPGGLRTQTIVDFRVGSVLGVVFVVASGDVDCVPFVAPLAAAQERKIAQGARGLS